MEVLQPGPNSSQAPLSLLLITGKYYDDFDDRQCSWEEALEVSPGQAPPSALSGFPPPSPFHPRATLVCTSLDTEEETPRGKTPSLHHFCNPRAVKVVAEVMTL